MVTIGHLLCEQGISGDLLLGALVDVGVPTEVLQAAADSLGVPGISVTSETIDSPFRAARVRVRVPQQPRVPNMASAQRMLDVARLPASVRSQSLDVMHTLCEAEARVHGVQLDDVWLHELGSLDTIVDVVAISSGLEWLGIDQLSHGVINVGAGSIEMQHGTMSVPAPAVAELLRGRTIEARGTRELTTPTGAAVLAARAGYASEVAPMRLTATGRGVVAPSGSMLTLLLGEPALHGSASSAVLLEATVDDLEPQLAPVVMDSLRERGALDVWAADTRMKKGRTGLTITVLCRPDRLDELRDALIRETPTLGVRWYAVQRMELERDHVSVEVYGAPVRLKRAWLDGRVISAHPESDDVVAAARAGELPVRDVYLLALRQASLVVEEDQAHWAAERTSRQITDDE